MAKQLLSEDDVRHYFQLILGRPPENEAVVRHYAGMALDPDAFARVLMDSDEFLERYRKRLALAGMQTAWCSDVWASHPGTRRVLLFGAYGNGNLGDAEQAEAVAWVLRRLSPDPLDIAAASWETRAPFHFPSGTVLRPEAMLRPERMDPASPQAASLVVIGGGGLLGAPHFPLHHEGWAKWFAGRGVPWAFIGVGGSTSALTEPGWREAYEILLRHARFAGLRDGQTIEAARALGAAPHWFPDPVLTRALLDDETMPSPGERAFDLLLIPRHPNSAADHVANKEMRRFHDTLIRDGRRVVVAGMEEVLDAPALEGRDVVYVHRWDDLMDLCRSARTVMSLRYHGVIAAIAAGCTVHGLVQPKIADLMERFGVGAWFAPLGWPAVDPDLSDQAGATFRNAIAPGFANMREQFAAAMGDAQRALFP